MASVLAEYPPMSPFSAPFEFDVYYDEIDTFKNRYNWGRRQRPTEPLLRWVAHEHPTNRVARITESLSRVNKILYADLKPVSPRVAPNSNTVSDVPFRTAPFARALFEEKKPLVSEHVASSASRTSKTPSLQSIRLETHKPIQIDGFEPSEASKTCQICQNSGIFHSGDTDSDSVYMNLTSPPGPCSAISAMEPAPMHPKRHSRYSTVAPENSVHEPSKALPSSEEQQLQKTSRSSQNILRKTPKRFMVFRWIDSFVCWIYGLFLMRVVHSLSRRDCTDKVYSEWYNSLCYVSINFCGFKQIHSVLVDTAASRGMISHDLAREYNLKITPTWVRIEGFNGDKAPTFATEEAAVHVEYNNTPFQVTCLVLQNPRYPLILPRSMLLAAGIVKFADGVMHEKLPGSQAVVSPLVAPGDARRWRRVREILFGRGKKVPDQKEVKLRRLQLERNDEEYRREAEDQVIHSIQDNALRAQRYQQEMRIREAWDLKHKAESQA